MKHFLDVKFKFYLCQTFLRVIHNNEKRINWPDLCLVKCTALFICIYLLILEFIVWNVSCSRLIVAGVHCSVCRAVKKQELSYRKQIARQLRTQYVEGIYRSNYPW